MAESTAASYFPSESAITLNVSPAIAATPAASPSSPSRKLTMFMIATIQRTARLVAGVEERERRHEHPEEEPDPAETRHRQRVHAPATGDVDHPETAGHASPGGRQQDHEGEGGQRAPED